MNIIVDDPVHYPKGADVPVMVWSKQSGCRPNCVVMSERLLTLLGGKLPEKSRRFRPFGVRRLRTKVRVKQ